VQVHPAIAMLRSNGASQHRTDAALSAWRARSDVSPVLEELAAYGAGTPLSGLSRLSELIGSEATARGFADRFLASLMVALRAEPLAQPRLGCSAAPGVDRVRLGESGRAALTLAVFGCRSRIAPRSVLFEDCEAHEIVLSGQGQAICYHRGNGAIEHAALDCAPGTRIIRKGMGEARQIVAVSRPLLVLQLTREAPDPQASHEVALPDGGLIKTISASKRDSQRMMALGVLGAIQHRPALDGMERLALDCKEQCDLRWEALRQLLGLDAARGCGVLARVAERLDDALHEPAAKLHRQLLATCPELAALEPA
jgi:hypothetical protein